ncbi:MAG: polysaccharide biosynthesis/export family protein [Bacteroidaceae bacterium]|nr:polysaccharide biosynthesis/export family protein [Bacteroidaceae bacterium]
MKIKQFELTCLGFVRPFLLSLGVALFIACSTPANIVYFQEAPHKAQLSPLKVEYIRLQPTDQISIVVNSRNSQVASMFNLPYYGKRLAESQSLTGSGGNMTASTQSISGYTVDSQGNIDFPVLGKIHVAGLTREEAEDSIKALLLESRQIKDPVVIVEFMNLGFSVLGEVSRPGRYKIDRDIFTLFDALSLAGDLTINGQREDVALVRHEGKQDILYRLNLLDIEQIYASPAFYVQQGDVIYVTPNEKRQRESTINGNNVRSTSFWISISSLATSITTLLISVMR